MNKAIILDLKGNSDMILAPPCVSTFLDDIRASLEPLVQHNIINTDSVEYYYVDAKDNKLLTIYQYRSLNDTSAHPLRVHCTKELAKRYPKIQELLISYAL